MTSDAPRPKKNSDGQDKKPSANPNGGGAPGAPAPSGGPAGPPSLVPPGVEMVGQFDQAIGQTGAVPQTPGAGVPDALQSFPQDASALLQVMNRGFAPGADNAEHGMAQNAFALARAHEVKAAQNAQQMVQSDQDQQMLGGLLQRLMMSGRLPHPDATAQAAQQQAGPPQLHGSY